MASGSLLPPHTSHRVAGLGSVKFEEMLLACDSEFLESRGLIHEVIVEGGTTCVLLPSWPLPTGCTLPRTALLLRLSAGYPDVPPDMWWFDPPVVRKDGQPIRATESREQYLGRQWQRWSRHLSPGQWQSGIDGLESYLALIRKELDQSCLESAS